MGGGHGMGAEKPQTGAVSSLYRQVVGKDSAQAVRQSWKLGVCPPRGTGSLGPRFPNDCISEE